MFTPKLTEDEITSVTARSSSIQWKTDKLLSDESKENADGWWMN
jgi:hypothetical protein